MATVATRAALAMHGSVCVRADTACARTGQWPLPVPRVPPVALWLASFDQLICRFARLAGGPATFPALVSSFRLPACARQ